MRGLIREVGIDDEERITSVVTIIDKMDKMSKDELTLELEKLNLTKESCNTLLECFSKSLEELTNIYKDSKNEELVKGLDELNNLYECLKGIGLEDVTVFAPALARGQDYYTGNVFEVYAKNGELSCSLGGGGRYDKMITDFIDDGNLYPAVGVSFGLSTIYEILKMRGDFNKVSSVDVLIIPLGTDCQSLKFANQLRDSGYNVEVEMTGKKIGKSFEYADRENIPYVIVLGENEVESRTCKVKDMRTKEEIPLNLDDIDNIKDVLPLSR